MKPVVIFTLLFLGACGYRDTQVKGNSDGGNGSQGVPPSGGSPSPGPGTAPDFATVRAQIFVPHCTRCHGSSGGINLETYERVRPNAQRIMAVVNSGRMPPAGPLIPSLKNILQAWVSAGAPLNAVGGPPSEVPATPGAPAPGPIPGPMPPRPCHERNHGGGLQGDAPRETLRRGDDDC